MKSTIHLMVTFLICYSLPILLAQPEIKTERSDLSALKVGESLNLPPPRLKGEISLEEAIAKRRSMRSFSGDSLSLEQISQLLWAGQGVTDHKRGLRSAPSAGAPDYPYNIYFVAKEGVFLYIPEGHMITKVKEGDIRAEIADAAEGQSWIKNAGIIMVLFATYEYTEKYGERGKMFVHIEAGHIAQNIHLQAVTLNLGSVPVGSLYPDKFKELIPMAKGEVIYLIPVGQPT